MAPSSSLPSSYATLPTKYIGLSHVPAESPTPTAVILVKLNRPEKNNAFLEAMAEELKEVFELFDIDDRVRAIVLTGAGKMFCAGADLEVGFLEGKSRDEAAPGGARDHRDRFVIWVFVDRTDPLIEALSVPAWSPSPCTTAVNQLSWLLMARPWASASP
jgi:hypothetical protein